MIQEIRLSNFFSIKDEIVLDLKAGSLKTQKSRRLDQNVIYFNDKQILKTIAIYGSNAAGKSNLINAIRFCARMVFNSHTHNENAIFNFQTFKFDKYLSKPSTFLINFIIEETEYEYSFSLTRDEILTEALYHYPNGRRAKVFTRNESNGPDKANVYSFGPVIRRPMDVASNTSRKTLFVSRASQMDRDIAKKLFWYFHNMFILDYYGIGAELFEKLFTENKELLLESLQIADNDICDIKIQKESRPTKNFRADFKSKEVSVEDADQEFITLKSFHKTAPKIAFDFDREESEGTKRSFFIMLTILDIIKENKTLIIDEIETSLHSRIVEYIIDLFHKGDRAQLIYSTHNTNLLNMDFLRKDQVYFINKKQDASSELYSLFDYKEFRDTMDAEKAYLQGRFDALPIINEASEALNFKKDEQKQTEIEE